MHFLLSLFLLQFLLCTIKGMDTVISLQEPTPTIPSLRSKCLDHFFAINIQDFIPQAPSDYETICRRVEERYRLLEMVGAENIVGDSTTLQKEFNRRLLYAVCSTLNYTPTLYSQYLVQSFSNIRWKHALNADYCLYCIDMPGEYGRYDHSRFDTLLIGPHLMEPATLTELTSSYLMPMSMSLYKSVCTSDGEIISMHTWAKGDLFSYMCGLQDRSLLFRKFLKMPLELATANAIATKEVDENQLLLIVNKDELTLYERPLILSPLPEQLPEWELKKRCSITRTLPTFIYKAQLLKSGVLLFHAPIQSPKRATMHSYIPFESGIPHTLYSSSSSHIDTIFNNAIANQTKAQLAILREDDSKITILDVTNAPVIIKTINLLRTDSIRYDVSKLLEFKGDELRFLARQWKSQRGSSKQFHHVSTNFYSIDINTGNYIATPENNTKFQMVPVTEWPYQAVVALAGLLNAHHKTPPSAKHFNTLLLEWINRCNKYFKFPELPPIEIDPTGLT